MTITDFTSSLYLCMQHNQRVIAPWTSLTVGRPAALHELSGAAAVARRLARLTGANDGLLLPSTLHAFCDLLNVRKREYNNIFIDAGAYPIAGWLAGSRAVMLPHHNPDSLECAVQRLDGRNRCVLILDGFCTGCGQTPPLQDYLRIANQHNIRIIIDDTQLLGLCGRRGEGISSVLSRNQVPQQLIIVASTAKGFGVPVAVVAGHGANIRELRENGKTRLHCSPPSAVDISALDHALTQNAQCGAGLRRHLKWLVLYFHDLLRAAGAAPLGMAFPVVTIPMRNVWHTMLLRRHLATRGIRVLARRLCRAGAVGLSFLVTVKHTICDLERAAAAVHSFMETNNGLPT